MRRRRPNKTASFETLAEQAGALTVEPDHLDQIAATATEHQQMTRIGILRQHLLGQRRQPVEPLALMKTSA